MLGRVQLIAPDGSWGEYAVYEDGRDLAQDYGAGVVSVGEAVVYRSWLYIVLGEFEGYDGGMCVQLLMSCPLRGFTRVFQMGGTGAYA